MTDSPGSSRKRPRSERQSRHSEAPPSSSSPSAHAMTTRSRSQSIAQLATKAAKTGSGLSAGEQQRKTAERTGKSRQPNEDMCTIPDKKAYVKDSESVSNDLEGADDDVLTLRAIKSLASEDGMLAKLGLVFSDPCTLARSFPQTDTSLAKACPVDASAVRKAYEIILGRSSVRVLEELRVLTVNAVSMLNWEPCDEHNNQMNAVLILLMNPLITEYKSSGSSSGYLFTDLCNAIIAQPSAQRTTLMHYLAADDGLPSDSADTDVSVAGAGSLPRSETDGRSTPFGRHIGIFQSYITREMVKAARRTQAAANGSVAADQTLQKVSLNALSSCSLPAVAQCLALMNSHNNAHNIVSYSLFYNDAVNEHIDIKDDVPRFRMPDSVSFCSYPFLLSPNTKSEIIRIESVILMRTELQDSFFRAMFSGVTCPYLVLEVRRDSLVRDTLYQLDLKLSQDLRKQLKVRFVGEEGVDEGGVQKEFFQLIVRDVFAPKYGIFKANDESQYHWFSHQSDPSKDALEEIRLTGQLIGLAVYNAVILDIHLPPAMYKKLLGMPTTRDDLREIDPTLHHGLMQLLRMSADELEFLDRTFEVEYDNVGELRTFELIPNGAQTRLTVDNREEFIDKYVDFVFNRSCDRQFLAFKSGFDRICGPSYVRFMRPRELELLVCGCSDLDFGALEGSTIYDGGYTRDTKVIQFFWEVVRGFTDELKRKLLFFATSSDRVPIGGLSKLHFVIAKNGGDSDRLPTSHTCFNVLLLPEYSNIDKLRERLLTAIHNSEGFGMI
ncbi:hypothetical protein LPJ53_002229 [Coemansia erecta]|uniref:HECT-type E3 ubiquitin transferase n=1 Tax=Coemansia erecta TaxID=147472 RepID=A0A9W7XYJ3_9FUNG|nr:hypothetical protein LPJ53_002229 [Coemansia erecta]